MRITSGILGGRQIKAPRDIRPTQDMVRQALFSSLGDRVAGARVLDLFAGSGALGLEAWSRGAAFVCWVEAEARASAALRGNVEGLCKGGAPVRVVRMDVLRFLPAWRDEPFDLILADPPYDRDGSRGWLGKILPALEGAPILRPDGLLVFEQGSSEPILERAGWVIVREKRYGEARLVMYGRTHEERRHLSGHV